jgi:hypothetical protein
LLFLDRWLSGVQVNNYAICALYNNRVSDAVAAFEELIRTDPIGCVGVRIDAELS